MNNVGRINRRPKIDYLDLACNSKHDVCALQIAMDDPLAVEVLETLIKV